jgi:hypothetical protein
VGSSGLVKANEKTTELPIDNYWQTLGSGAGH